MLVHAEKIAIQKGALGCLTLRRPEALNALSAEMFQQMRVALEAWEKDPDVKAVILDSSSDRAFCAGGDVKNVVLKAREEDLDFAQEFFVAEYSMDYDLHCYPKPILCWAQGITMGGGIGLMNGCSHRVATEASLFAMPEISIGFFPDVGGGYFLNRLPDGVGLFLGLTGARFRGGDAVALGMADSLIKHEDKQQVVDRLSQTDWSEAGVENFAKMSEALESFRLHEIQSDLALPLTELGRRLSGFSTLEQVDEFLRHQEISHEALESARIEYVDGSPLVARVIYEHIGRCRNLSLAQVFAVEWSLAIRFCSEPEFQEGVRALLIDKDKRPEWRFSSLKDVPKKEWEYLMAPVEPNLLSPHLAQRSPRTSL
ncbi:MAG: enoyl-CoA hydratase/isomerase family protein [Bdellovibrionaceae bacterium]|nr:enoyl-CoA hydratase/isomerase family protein [Bdellovibrionales bacterium]MCB9083482.1 enoyl-CoA hydratase/isomerase family protein [Pseudobdellovibrionaceae bacterium]